MSDTSRRGFLKMIGGLAAAAAAGFAGKKVLADPVAVPGKLNLLPDMHHNGPIVAEIDALNLATGEKETFRVGDWKMSDEDLFRNLRVGLPHYAGRDLTGVSYRLDPDAAISATNPEFSVAPPKKFTTPATHAGCDCVIGPKKFTTTIPVSEGLLDDFLYDARDAM